MMQATKAGECPRGFYRSASGAVCCQQCEAGKYLISDCTAEQGHSGCQVCDSGTYTALPNSSGNCLMCTPCQSDEDEEQECSTTADRRCRCKPGYHKRGSEHFCREDSVAPVTSSTTRPPDSGRGKAAAIVVAVVWLLLIIAAGAAAFIHKKKRRKFPRDGKPGNSDQPGSTASPLLAKDKQNPEAGPSADSIEVKFIKDNRAEIIRLVCDDPGSLLDEVESLGYADVYSTAIAQTNKEYQCETLIDEMMSLGQKACQDLIRALDAVQDKHEGLQQLLNMINDSGSAGRPLHGNPSASESDADQRKSQTTTHPDGPDGDQRGVAETGEEPLNNPEDGDELRSTICV
ncbi:uncharacterized protein LOC142906606 [Petromyzon marinus]|uniref:uncharacterized protein LOC142906606 n=1 Tax=Petromyzon marinus TaxID=7757 RepID=UPI003F6FB559